MARNKNPEVTINRILDTARKLFIQKGYENTTIQDIVNELKDLSKGAIYYHFKSKEEIINAVVSHYFSDNSPFDAIDQSSLNGLDKIRQVFLANMKYNTQQPRELFHAASNLLKNPKFLSQYLKETITYAACVLQGYIEEGNNDGSLSIKYPKQTAEMCTILINIWINLAIFDVSFPEFQAKIKCLKEMFESIGIPVYSKELEKELYYYYSEYHIN